MKTETATKFTPTKAIKQAEKKGFKPTASASSKAVALKSYSFTSNKPIKGR